MATHIKRPTHPRELTDEQRKRVEALAPDLALDGDVILAAQAAVLG